MTRSIKTKILAAQVSQIFAAVVILGLTSYTLIYELHSTEELEHLQYVAQINGNLMETFLVQKQGILERIASSENVERYTEKYQEQMLLQYFNKYSSEFSSLAIANKIGEEEVKMVNGHVSEDLHNVYNSLVFQRAATQPNTAIFAFPQGSLTPESTIEFAYWRQNFFDECVGVVIGKIAIATLSRQLVQSEIHDHSYALFTNAQGEILAHTNQSLIGQVVPETILKEDVTHHSVSTQRINLLSEDCFVAIAPVSKHGFVSLAVYPANVFLAAPSKLREQTVIILIAFMGVAYIASVLMAYSLSKPIMKLSISARQIAQGDFGHRVEITSNDEVGLLEQSFNDMLEHLEKSTTSIEALNQEIEQRQEAECRQTELLHQIEATNQELSNFAHIVSHDLKAPLRGIRSIACWLQEDYADKLDEAGRNQLQMLTQRVLRMRNLIEGILQYSRVGRVKEEIKIVDLNKALPEVIDLLAAPDNMTITINRPLPTVHYETTRLTQIFQNLLSNALKYIDKPQGKIHIDYTEDDEFWTFSVSDNGPGIDPKYFDKIFGIFQTLNPRDEYESTGIGLAVIKKSIDAVGGKIWVTSELGKGCTFSFTVPKNLELTPESETKEAPLILMGEQQ